MSNEKKEVAKVVTLPKSAEPKTATTTQADEKKSEKPLTLSQMLEKQLTEIKRKKQLADRRAIFMAKCEEVSECLTLVADEQASGNFTTDNFTLIFAKKNGGYTDKEAFRLSNPEMVIKFLEMLKNEMAIAVKVIESELMKDI